MLKKFLRRQWQTIRSKRLSGLTACGRPKCRPRVIYTFPKAICGPCRLISMPKDLTLPGSNVLLCIRKIKIWQFPGDKACARAFRQWAKAAYPIEAVISSNIDDVTLNADIVVTSTPSRAALVNRISPGAHINAIGADAPNKQEISPDILQQAKVVIDDWAQASHSGEINVPLKQKLISKKDIYASLGDIVAGKKKGRTSTEEITLFDTTGLAIQDIACAYEVYRALKNKRGIKSIRPF